MIIHKGDKIGIIGCSNAQLLSYKAKIDALLETIVGLGLTPVCSNCLFEKYSVFSGTARERAGELNRFYSDPDIKAIFDISGGDVANEILEYIDFEMIGHNPKPFFGYSDLTTVLNAIYTMTGQTTYLYQIRNLIYHHKKRQTEWFEKSLMAEQPDLFKLDCSFLQGDHLEGIVVGGNLRCLLKLAGTPYLPVFDQKVLMLEAYGGEPAVITTLLYQLKHMGVFSKVNGILLGTFTNMEKEQYKPTVEDILKRVLEKPSLPIARTTDLGHGTDSKCIAIGRYLKLESRKEQQRGYE